MEEDMGKGLTSIGGWRAALAAWAVAMLVAAWGCSRPDVIPGDSNSAQAELPASSLQSASDQTAPELSRTGIHWPASRRSASGNDFRGTFQELPAGTLLTVRLKRSVYASTSPSEGSFEAVVEQPVVMDGNIIIPKGANVAGRVESAQTSRIKPNRGYVRLALQSVDIGDRQVALQTASLFAREAPLGNQPISVIHLEQGRRLTFRLAEAADTAKAPDPVTR
jgi:hypothetical protein